MLHELILLQCDTTPNKNVSVSAPKPSASNSEESGYSPAHPSTFDPVQPRCGLKDARCTEYIDTHKGVVDSEISLSMVDDLVKLNNLFITRRTTRSDGRLGQVSYRQLPPSRSC